MMSQSLFSSFSIAKSTFKGQQRPDISEADRIGRTKMGNKEASGFSENNDGYVHTADNPARFITHYQTRSVFFNCPCASVRPCI